MCNILYFQLFATFDFIFAGEKPKLQCDVCNKKFLSNHELDSHARIHTREKPFFCEICGMSFTLNGNMLRHVKIHSREKLAKGCCDICGKSGLRGFRPGPTQTRLYDHTIWLEV